MFCVKFVNLAIFRNITRDFHIKNIVFLNKSYPRISATPEPSSAVEFNGGFTISE